VNVGIDIEKPFFSLVNLFYSKEHRLASKKFTLKYFKSYIEYPDDRIARY